MQIFVRPLIIHEDNTDKLDEDMRLHIEADADDSCLDFLLLSVNVQQSKIN